MIAKRVLSTTFYFLLIFSILIYTFFDKEIGVILGLFFTPITILYFYVFFSQEIKEGQVKFTVAQNLIIIFSSLTAFSIFFQLLLSVFHWPFKTFFIIIVFLFSCITAILSIVDLFRSFLRKEKVFGYQYFLLLLPCLLYFRDIEKLINKDYSKGKELILLDEMHSYHAYQAKKENDLLVNKLYALPCIDSAIVKTSIKYSEEALKTISDVRNGIIEETGGLYAEDGYKYYKGYDVKNKVKINLVNKGNALRVQTSVNNYCSYLRSNGYSRSDLVLDGLDHPLFKYDPRNNSKKFPELFFGDVTLLEALNILSLMEVELIAAERNFLNEVLIKCAGNN